MRSCEEFELLINLYLDDMLPSEETRPLKEHLKECQACRERYRQCTEGGTGRSGRTGA